MFSYSIRRCCVPGCAEIGKETNQPLHRFPNPEIERERFNTWLYTIGGDIIGLGSSFIFKYSRVCRRHFELKYLCRNNRISKIAIPTLNMPDVRTSRKYNFEDKRQMPEVQNVVDNPAQPTDVKLSATENFSFVAVPPYSDIVKHEPILPTSNELKADVCPDEDMDLTYNFTDGHPIQLEAVTDPDGCLQPRDDNLVQHFFDGAIKSECVWQMNMVKTDEEADNFSQKPFSESQENQKAWDWPEKRKTLSTKRTHSDNTEDQLGKIARMELTKPSFSDFTGSYRVVIRDIRRSMNLNEVQLLQERILQCIDSSNGEKGPKFTGCAVRAGCLVLTCFDRATRDWISSRLPTLKLWEGADLRLLEEDILPKSCSGTIWIPDPKLEPKAIIERLKLQNDEIVGSHWKIVNTKGHNRGQTVTFSFNEDALEGLRSQHFRLFFGFRDIPIWIKTVKKDAEEAVASSSSTWIPVQITVGQAACTLGTKEVSVKSAFSNVHEAGRSDIETTGVDAEKVVTNIKTPTI